MLNENIDTELTIDRLLPFFKALADANRLKIIGLLANQSLTVEQLSEMLGLRPSTISHHLAQLSAVGLVSARAESYYNLYQLETGVLEKLSRRLLARETLPAMAADVDLEAYDRKVVANFTLPNGHLKAFPAQRKKMEALLRHIVQAFEPGLRYTERGVNEILSRYHEDVATLRRELVDSHLLFRESSRGEYWRPAASEVGEVKDKKAKHKKKKK